MHPRTLKELMAVALLLAASRPALPAPTPQQKCQAVRADAAGRYAFCEQHAQAKLQTMGNGSLDEFSKFQLASSKCRLTYARTWDKLQRMASDLSGTSCIGPRFTDNGATVTDNLTGLEWEKKTSLNDEPNLADPQDADNTYSWSASGTAGDGTVYANFLAGLNSSTCFAGQCDWRLPTRQELETILSQPYPCSSPPCVDFIFGPTQEGFHAGFYWTASTYAADSTAAWLVTFFDGQVYVGPKTHATNARAVRGGL